MFSRTNQHTNSLTQSVYLTADDKGPVNNQKYKLEPINTRLHRRANKIWEKVASHNPILTESSRLASEDENERDHRYWPRIQPYTALEEPEPIIIY